MYKIILLGSFFFLSLACSEKKDPTEITPKFFQEKMVLGEWKLSPSLDSEEFVFEKNGIVVLSNKKQGTQNRLAWKTDSVGVKILNSEGVIQGYFLYDDRLSSSWAGVWNGELVRLFSLKNPQL